MGCLKWHVRASEQATCLICHPNYLASEQSRQLVLYVITIISVFVCVCYVLDFLSRVLEVSHKCCTCTLFVYPWLLFCVPKTTVLILEKTQHQRCQSSCIVESKLLAILPSLVMRGLVTLKYNVGFKRCWGNMALFLYFSCLYLRERLRFKNRFFFCEIGMWHSKWMNLENM